MRCSGGQPIVLCRVAPALRFLDSVHAALDRAAFPVLVKPDRAGQTTALLPPHPIHARTLLICRWRGCML
jgi:hypothetical protein